MKKNRKYYKTIIISDVHLGTSGSKAEELVSFLKKFRCKNLILNGDIIDGWQLKKYGMWKKKHTAFFRQVLKMIEKDNTRVIYLRGNHDDFLDQVMPFRIGNFSIQRDFIYESFGKKYLVVHGDLFDTVTNKLKWIAKLGDIGYTFLLWLNKQYNHYRSKRGLPYYSLSREIKLRVKSAVNFISDFERQLAEVAKVQGCAGIICGHIHQPAIKQLSGVLYLNSGDWVESLTALVETEQGEWEILHFNEEDHDLNEDDLEYAEESDMESVAWANALLSKQPVK